MFRFSKHFLLAPLALAAGAAFAVQPDSNSLLGIHWYSNTDAISVGQHTDVEDMSNNVGIWILQITHLNTAAAPAWDQPGYFVGHSQKAAQGKGHSFVYRIQPYWSANVPHPGDPYTVTNFANDAKSAAITLKDWVHIWQVGNEVNLDGENYRWNSTANNYSGTTWQPTPAEYAATYLAVRDKIHEVDATISPATEIVLMQPVSPGNAAGGVRYMDGNEFLYRMIDAVPDKSKIDGFGLHGYAEPGGTNFGYDGFFDSLREQIMIIDSFGLGDRPIFVTEFNKHMPNAGEANIGAKFLHRAYANVAAWNAGTGGTIPGVANHDIVSLMWFVYPHDQWTEYSLGRWKTDIASTDYELNPWYSFLHAAQSNPAAGAFGGGPASIPQNQLWFQDAFSGSVVDQTGPLPDWKVEPIGSGTASVTGGKALLRGNGSNFGGCTLGTAGYAFSDFRLEADVTLVNAARASNATTEANFDVRVREGSLGYSLTFFTSQSGVNTNKIMLRRVNNWGENIGSFQTTVGGNGIATGDAYRIVITAQGATIHYQVYENGGVSPIADWNVTDGGQRVGGIRIGTYNLNELDVDQISVGGPAWSSTSAVDPAWQLY